MENKIKTVNKNPYWIFILALYATKQMIFEIVEYVTSFNEPLLKANEVNKVTENLNGNFIYNVIQIITVIILFFVYRSYFRMREREEMQNRKIEVLQYYAYTVIFDNPQKWVTKIEADVERGYITKKEKEEILFTVIKPPAP